MKIEAYADGSATIVGKPGGYGWVLVVDGVKHSEGSGHMESATNNDAELAGANAGLAAALKFILANNPENPEVTLVSDSQIVLGWTDGTYKFKQKKKMDKFNILQTLVQRMKVKTRWVKGHNNDEHNTRCDKLAGEARKGLIKAQKDEKESKEEKKSLIGVKKRGTMSVWYKDTLKIIDLDHNVVENYHKKLHGPRSGYMEVRSEKK